LLSFYNFSNRQDYAVDGNIYDDEDDDDILPDDGNDMVDVDDHTAGSSNHRTHTNHQNVDSSDNLRSFRPNYLAVSHHVDDDDENEPEPESDELLNHSINRKKR